ncbi:MAG: SBBP repeat-containing protein [Planctomycetes bacterium]|nr:SBBP repeat-containing protein [Planctomycetota bacterium]
MTQRSPTPDQRPPSGLRRWLRCIGLSRIPLLGRFFFRPRKPQPAPKPVRKSTALGGEALESRNVPDYIYALAQTALLGDAALYIAASLRTPEQVFLHGWGDSSYDPAIPQAERSAVPLPPDLADASFVNMTVTSPPEERTPSSEEEQTPPTQPAPADAPAREDGHEPTHFISADEALAPVFDQAFLDQARQLLQDALAASGGGLSPPVASPGDFTPSEPTGLGDGGSFRMGLGGADGVVPPTNVGAGPSFGTDFDPFLSTSFGQGGGSPAALAAPAGTGADASTGNGADGTAAPADLTAGFGSLVQADQGGTGDPSAVGTAVAPLRPVLPPSLPVNFGKLPLAFERNEGQTDPSVSFMARGKGYGIFLTSTEAVAVLAKSRPASPAQPGSLAEPASLAQPDQQVPDVLRIQFAGASSDTPLVGEELLPGRSNYFRGDQAPITDVAQFGQVTAQNVWQGVDVVYQGDQGNLRFDFDVHPGADVSQVALNYVGTDSMSVDDQGNLVLHTPSGDVLQETPAVYTQAADGSRQAVTARYDLRSDGTVGFQVDARDANAELIIDPTLVFSTYLGGSNTDYGYALAVDVQGNVYLTGDTCSTNFPTQNPYQSSNPNYSAVFITKMRGDGSALVYSTYLVGFLTDSYAIAVDAGYCAYVTGETLGIPTTSGAFQTVYGGDWDAFVTKLSPAGNALVYSTYLGGASVDGGAGIAVDNSGSAYVTGWTNGYGFPTTSGAYQTSLPMGTVGAFVTKLNAAGSGLVYSSFLSGTTSGTSGKAIAVDAAGNAFVGGYTTAMSFPTTTSAYDRTLGGQDGFLTEFNAAGSGLIYSTFLGGSAADAVNGVALDSSGRAYVTGYTNSMDYPTTPGAYQTMPGMSGNAFVTQVEPSGSILGYSTFLGGSGGALGQAIAVDGERNAYITGSTAGTFPITSGAPQSTYGGGTSDAFVTRLNVGGASLGWSTFLGGNGDDRGYGIGVDFDGNVFATGWTSSYDFPTVSPFQSFNAGYYDAFVTKYAQLLPPPVLTTITYDSGSSNSDQITNDQTLTLSGTAQANAMVTLDLAGVGTIGTTTADSSGLWTFSYEGTWLPEGIATFTGTQTVSDQTSGQSAPFPVTVDLTPPVVTLTFDSPTTSTSPQVEVTASDDNLASTTTVTLDVDLNNDFDFADTGETGYTTGTMTDGLALITISPPLSIGTVRLRARVSDKAGNEGQSAVKSLTVQSTTGSPIFNLTQQVDPFTGDPVFQRGDLVITQPLDLDLSPGTAVSGNPALVYNSDRVNVKPIITAGILWDSNQTFLPSVNAQLTFKGVTQPMQSYSTSGTGLSPGDLIVVAQQAPDFSVINTGRITYTLSVTLNYAMPVTRSITGTVFAVVEETNSPFGYGWALAPVDKLFSIPQQTAGTYTFAPGMLREYGAGGHGFYTDNGNNGYISPPGDNGTLTKATAGGVTTYVYYTPDGRTSTFNGSGQEVNFQSADGQETTSFSYDPGSGYLTGLQTPDGALTTLAYGGGLNALRTIQTGTPTGTRTVTVTVATTASSTANVGDLAQVTNPDGGLHTLSYDIKHKLTQDSLGDVSTTYVYSNGLMTGYTPGAGSGYTNDGGGAYVVQPVVLFGLASLAKGPLYATLTDPLSHTTRKQVDLWGRPTLIRAADGGRTQLLRDSNGWVTKQTDPLYRVTTYVLDGAGYPAWVYLPDGSTQQSQFQASYTPGAPTVHHALTQYTNERGYLWTYTYDNQGHRLSEKDPLGHLTTSSYYSSGAENGLLRDVQDALGRFTTFSYYPGRQLSSTQDALGGLATVGYDVNGNLNASGDAEGRITYYTNDPLGRVLQVEDPEHNVVTETYDASGLDNTDTDPEQVTTSHVYNSRGLEIKRIEAVGTAEERTTLKQYDAAGQLTDLRDPSAAWHTYSYDPAGRLKQQSDPWGSAGMARTTRFYDPAGQLTKVLDPLVQPTLFGYNLRGWPTIQVDALGQITTTLYDAAGNVTTMINARGYATTIDYDPLNRQTGVTEAAGVAGQEASTVLIYDDVGNLIKQYDARDTLIQIDYDQLNRATTVTLAVDVPGVERALTYAYDKVGNQVSMTDGRGVRTDTKFDKLNRPTEVKQDAASASPALTTTVYDPDGNVLSVKNALGQVTSYGYDALDHQVTEIDNYGGSPTRTLTTVYDALDHVTQEIDGLNHATQTAYDLAGLPFLETDPLGKWARTYYDAAGNVIKTLDRNLNPTTYTFDRLNREATQTNALGQLSTTLYDANGNVWVTIDPRSNRTTYVYDARDRQIQVTDALGHLTSTAYDAVGNVTKQIDALGKVVSYTYDELNQRIEEQAPGAGVFTTAYDKAGHVIGETNGVGDLTTYVYDNLGRKTQAVDGPGVTITYDYDKGGNLLDEVDPLGNRTTFTYDDFNRLKTETDPLSHTLSYFYDKADNLQTVEDRLGRLLNYYDDADNRLVQAVWQDASWTALNTLVYSYDNNGNVLTAADSHGLLTTTYDKLNREATVQDVWGITLTYDYDGSGNRKQVQDTKGGYITSVYDEVNRLSNRQFSDGTTPLRFDLGYTVRDQVATLTYYSDLAGTTKVDESSYAYDDGGRVWNILHKNGAGTNLINVTYTYDPAERLYTEQRDGALRTFSYDHSSQVTNDGSSAYGYDAGGNRNMTGYQLGAGNRLSNDGTWTYTYDNEGNVTKKSKGASAETWNYTYDNRNQLVGATDRSTDGGTLLAQATYTYDVRGRRIQEDLWQSGMPPTSSTTRFAYDGADVWADLNSSNAVIARYIRPDGVDALAARVQGTTVGWYLTDRQGSVLGLTNNSGALQGTLTYGGFGVITQDTTGTFGDRWKYTGREWQSLLKLQYNRDRWYNPATSTWMSEDPERFDAGDFNLHRYTGNSPTNHTDPSGRVWWVVGGLVGAVYGVASQFVSDVVSSVSSGEWKLSSGAAYAGAAVGGFAGGAVFSTTGSFQAAGAAAGFASNLTTQLLTKGSVNVLELGASTAAGWAGGAVFGGMLGQTNLADATLGQLVKAGVLAGATSGGLGGGYAGVVNARQNGDNPILGGLKGTLGGALKGGITGGIVGGLGWAGAKLADGFEQLRLTAADLERGRAEMALLHGGNRRPVSNLNEALEVVNSYRRGHQGDPRDMQTPAGRVTIEGCPQKTDTPMHRPTVAEMAARRALSGEYERVVMDRGINEYLGEDLCQPNVRPDVLGIRRDGKIDMLEVRSDGQTHEYLHGLLRKAQDQMKPEQRGKIEVIDPFPEK